MLFLTANQICLNSIKHNQRFETSKKHFLHSRRRSSFHSSSDTRLCQICRKWKSYDAWICIKFMAVSWQAIRHGQNPSEQENVTLTPRCDSGLFARGASDRVKNEAINSERDVQLLANTIVVGTEVASDIWCNSSVFIESERNAKCLKRHKIYCIIDSWLNEIQFEFIKKIQTRSKRSSMLQSNSPCSWRWCNGLRVSGKKILGDGTLLSSSRIRARSLSRRLFLSRDSTVMQSFCVSLSDKFRP